jgi:iron complex transport system ATP-binding protein
VDNLSAEEISFTVNGKLLLHNTSISFNRGEFTVILGANGAGKTTLIKCLANIIKPSTGHVTLGGFDVKKISAKERAKFISYIPQNPSVTWPSNVRNVVALGRFAYGSIHAALTDSDLLAVDTALHECDVYHLSNQSVETLSGGELARVHFARALCSRTPFLLADEPIASLDIAHQIRTMKLLKSYTGGNLGAIVVMHDTSLAINYADRIVWMKNGSVVSDGTPKETVMPETIEDVFNINARIDWHKGNCTIRLE